MRSRSGSRCSSPASTRSRAPSSVGSATPACEVGSTCTRPRNTKRGRASTTPGSRWRSPPHRESGEETMSEAIVHADARHHAGEHHEIGFIRTYIFSTDHKTIGKQFLGMGLSMFLLGGILALLVRWELAWPANGPTGAPVPGMGWLSQDFMPQGYISPNAYNAFFTM